MKYKQVNKDNVPYSLSHVLDTTLSLSHQLDYYLLDRLEQLHVKNMKRLLLQI